jgi:aminoglycoside/choline kinase family phosphotransferase
MPPSESGSGARAAEVLPLDGIERLVARATGTPPPLELEEIYGGASVRRFFRIKTRAGSVVAMYVPVASHEIAKAPAQPRPWAFLEVRDLLESRGVRVPALLATARDEGLILVEDLGETLAQHLVRRPRNRERLYAAAVSDLCAAQRALGSLPAGSIVAERVFDEDLLRWEVDHFREWALDARGIALSAAERGVFERAAAHLARTIAAWPRGFVHRDYQSRNLMVVGSDEEPKLAWIDFQDAMLGPRIYDMVALLSDSYQTFSRDFVESRLDEFTSALELSAGERATVGREFQLVTVQRKLKDAGRFVFFERVNGNPHFLSFVTPTIQKAQAALAELSDDPVLRALRELLAGLFPPV